MQASNPSNVGKCHYIDFQDQIAFQSYQSLGTSNFFFPLREKEMNKYKISKSKESKIKANLLEFFKGTSFYLPRLTQDI